MFKSLKDHMKPAQSVDDFRIKISDPEWKQEWIDLLSAHTTRVIFSATTLKVNLSVRQLKDGSILGILFQLIQNDAPGDDIEELRIKPAKDENYELVFRHGTIVNHGIAYRFGSGENTCHGVEVLFENVTMNTKGGESYQIFSQDFDD